MTTYRVQYLFVPVKHSCGHVRGWGRPLRLGPGESPVDDQQHFTPDTVADMRASTFIHGTGEHPCPWCGGATGKAGPFSTFILDTSPDALVTLDEAAWGVLLVELDTTAHAWRALGQDRRQTWMTSADVEAVRQHGDPSADVDLRGGWVLDVEEGRRYAGPDADVRRARPPVPPNRAQRRQGSRHRRR